MKSNTPTLKKVYKVKYALMDNPLTAEEAYSQHLKSLAILNRDAPQLKNKESLT